MLPVGGVVRPVQIPRAIGFGGKTEILLSREAEVREDAQQGEGRQPPLGRGHPSRRLNGQEPIEQEHRAQQQRHVHRQQVAAVDGLINREGHDGDDE